MATFAPTSTDPVDAMAAMPSTSASSAPLFTCLSCSIGFPRPEDQRSHYRTDLHRYNMKRRVANLPPVRADVFNAKVLERRKEAEKEQLQQQHHRGPAREGKCDACNKVFSSANAYKDHMNSRKHKETVARTAPASTKATSALQQGEDPLIVRLPAREQEPLESLSKIGDALPESAEPSSASAPRSATATEQSTSRVRPDLTVSEDATEEEIQAAIDAKLATSKRVDPASTCLFCLQSGFAALDDSLEHMRKYHGFWLPEQDYLVDKSGLMAYLSDKICVGNICLYCNGRGRGFQTAEAVRKHMLDKSHCKVAYHYEEDKLELSDFYDFTSSYPDAGWEDVSDEGESFDEDGDEIITEEEENSDDETLPATDAGIRFGDNELELVLPSGARLGHRSLRRYYNQSLRPPDSAYNASSSSSGRQLAHRLNGGPRQKESTLVESRGGNVIYARDRGQAREAKRHIKEFRDVKRREQYKTQIGFRNNNQKHFRDPLLQ